MQELHLERKVPPTFGIVSSDSETRSEAEVIPAVHAMTNGVLPVGTDRLSLQRMLAEAQGQQGYYTKVWALRGFF